MTYHVKNTYAKSAPDTLQNKNIKKIMRCTGVTGHPLYKQCVRPIFEYCSLSITTTSDTIISKIRRLQNKFQIQLVLRLPKYIGVKLLHDSSGLPCVKDRLLSCATRTLERISKNPLVEESITFNRVNPACDRFPTALSVIRPIGL